MPLLLQEVPAWQLATACGHRVDLFRQRRGASLLSEPSAFPGLCLMYGYGFTLMIRTLTLLPRDRSQGC